MKTMSTVKRSIITAICIALCVVLPQAFHAIPNAGSVYLPMHIPVYLCGMISGWPYGILCGLAGPLLSSLITGMPMMAYLPGMMVELFCYGAISGLVFRLVRTKNLYADIYAALVSAMLLGRIIAGLVKAFILAPGELTAAAWATSYFVTGLPGIVIQLIVIPGLLLVLMKSRLIPQRYPKAKA